MASPVQPSSSSKDDTPASIYYMNTHTSSQYHYHQTTRPQAPGYHGHLNARPTGYKVHVGTGACGQDGPYAAQPSQGHPYIIAHSSPAESNTSNLRIHIDN